MMKWLCEIEWMDGQTENIVSHRHSHPQREDANLIIYVNPHGHDGRFDEIVIPLVNVRRYSLTEVK